jgi:hypothetical protein
MSDVCMFCNRETVEGRAVCAECPSPVEVLAMDISDLQDSVAELNRRLSGKRPGDIDEEQMSVKERYERMLRLVQAVVGERGR